MAHLAWLFAGVLVGSFFGHWVHWALHRRWSGAAHRAHMRHHLAIYPPGRLVSERYDWPNWWESGTFLFAPPTLVVAALGVFLGASPAFVAGLLAYALASDFAHDRFHVRSPRLERSAWWLGIRAAHFRHHRRMRSNFGILTLAWDRVFGTLER